MTQVAAASAANHFGTHHTVTVIGKFLECFWIGRSQKTGPSGTGIEFIVRQKQFLPIGRATVNPLLVVIPIGAGKGSLRAFLSHDAKLLFGEQLLPFLFGFNHRKLFVHGFR